MLDTPRHGTGATTCPVRAGRTWLIGPEADSLCKPERMPRSPLWHQRDFMRLWGPETISQLGTGIMLLALPLIATEVLDASAPQVGAPA